MSNLSDQQCRKTVMNSKYPSCDIFLIKKNIRIIYIYLHFFFRQNIVSSNSLTGLHHILYTQTILVYGVGTWYL